MRKIINQEEWVKQINGMIERLYPLNCDKCLPDFFDRMVFNEIVESYDLSKLDDKTIDYVITGGIEITYKIGDNIRAHN
jgi:hypothetical protein